MKSYYKSELAMMAGVSVTTLNRWLKNDREELSRLGVGVHTRLLPPIAVDYICRKYGITIDESLF